MSFHFADIARHAAADGTVTEDEILQLRQSGWADGRMSREEAEAVFAAQHALTDPTVAWSDFFVEAIRNFVLVGSEPRNMASEDEGRWLIAQVQADGRVCSMAELELLVQIIEKADNVPLCLKDYVLGVIEREVLTGTGPTRCGGELSDNHVSEAEARIIRRVIFGSAGHRPAGVSRVEAEMLFRVKNETLGADNAPDFKTLFVQGVGNYLMGYASANAQLSHERARELEAFIADNKADFGRFMGAMARSAPNAFGVVFGRKSPLEPNRADQVEAAAEITVVEREWLDAQIAANGEIDSYDRALLEFLAEETGEA